MKLLLISDTHGHLDIINGLVKKTNADAVLHAGDFGFYDHSSTDHLVDRELNLRIIHSGLSDTSKKYALKLPNPYIEYFSSTISNSSENVNQTYYNYDALDRVTQVTNPDGTTKQIVFNRYTISDFDELGNRHITN